MQLNIPERIIVLDLLPKEGHYADIKTLRVVREILSLTDEEVKSIEYREEETEKGRLAFFDIPKAVAAIRDLPVDEWTTNTVASILAKKEKDGKLEEKHATLYEKFVLDHE